LRMPAWIASGVPSPIALQRTRGGMYEVTVNARSQLPRLTEFPSLVVELCER
jgi:hypothetical protein